MKRTTTRVIPVILSAAALLLLPAVVVAQPDPGGPPGGGMAGVPIDPASWLIPAGLAAYYKWKQRKEKQPDTNQP